MSVKLGRITEHALKVGEGPHWDERAHALYFVGIDDRSIHKYDPATGEHTQTRLDGRPGFIVPVEGHLDQFVVGLEREFVVVQWDGTDDSNARVVRFLGEVDDHAPANRINDGKADPRGRLYAGTMGPQDLSGRLQLEQGSFYRLDESGITRLCDKISVSNGLAWDLPARALYYTDTMERKIRKYDYDVESGNISNLRYIFDFDKNNVKGFPDGMTIDTDGNLWVAVFGGGCVLQVSPNGDLLNRVPLPATQVTSCTFGGPDMNILFVTTACVNMEKPPNGCTFMITGLGATGHPNNRFKLEFGR